MGYQRMDWNEIVVVDVAQLKDKEEDGFSRCLLCKGVVLVWLAELRLDEIDCGGEVLHPEGLGLGIGLVAGMRHDFRHGNG